VTSIDEEMQRAISVHRAGELAQARNAYERILARHPRHFQALHLSGVIASQTGDAQLAVRMIWRSIEINPGNGAAYCDLGSALKQLNQLPGALASYDRAIALDGALADAYSNRGTVLCELHRFEEALASLDRALELRPDFAAASLNRARVLALLNRPGESLEAYDRTIAMSPGFADAHFNKGNLLMSAKRWDEALASYSDALCARPNYPEALLNRGIVLRELGRAEAALASLSSAIALDGRCAEALANSGVLQRELGQYEKSLASFDRAIAAKPQYAEAHCGKGNTLKALNRFEEALSCYERAIELKHDLPEAHSSRGVALAELRRFDDAFASFDAATALKPDYAEAWLNRALASLTLGRFTGGWADYEWRRKCTDAACGPAAEKLTKPAWRGEEPLAGRTILLWWEQGLGDTLQFCRYVPLVASLGATVILEVQPQLVGVLADSTQALVRESGDALPHFDYQCPLMSLPLAFKTTLSSIPFPGKYLQSDPSRVSHWREKLGARYKPRVGLVWSGSTAHRNDHNRSVALSQLLQFLPGDLQYVSLQVDVRDEDREALNQRPDILDCGLHFRDFRDTAALCESLDLLITVDTSVAHLGGALGKQTWVLLPFASDWRWLLDRMDSPWYASLRLYRQDGMGNWGGTLARLNDDLRQHFSPPQVLTR
jgi:tetratricopeptide (TPR) repeat protein